MRFKTECGVACEITIDNFKTMLHGTTFNDNLQESP